MRRRALLALLACVLFLAGWAFVWEPSRIGVTRRELPVPAWPPEQAGLRVALLADLHVGSPHYGLDTLARVVERVNSKQPDLVLLAGDFVIHGVVGGSFVAPEALAPVLAGLEAPLGVYAVLGNHDWWLDGPRVRRALVAAGISVLEDEAIRVSAGRFSFWLVGLGDWWEAPPDVEAALAGTDDGAPILAFTHNPDVFPTLPSAIALTLAGHTHGGQVRLPLFGTPVVPSQYGSRYARGHVVEEGRHLFVTCGLGTSILPVRFRVPPEIALLVIGDR
jgi:predicted MPP superfamily phosphohydrolase